MLQEGEILYFASSCCHGFVVVVASSARRGRLLSLPIDE